MSSRKIPTPADYKSLLRHILVEHEQTWEGLIDPSVNHHALRYIKDMSYDELKRHHESEHDPEYSIEENHTH